MIKAPKRTVAVCRNAKGKVVSTVLAGKGRLQRHWGWRLPLVRGVISLGELLGTGMRALSWSANQQAEKEEKLSAWHLALTMAFSIGLAVVLFIVLPYYLTRFFTQQHDVWFNLLDGVFRLVIFLAYIMLIGLMPDVKRLYQYHGAEHKAVHCYEAGLPLTVKNVRFFSPCHPRCGTSLIVFVIIISIIVFSLVRLDAWYWNLLIRILLLPVVAGLSYEALKLTARFAHHDWLSWLTWPGIGVQKITTAEPDARQIDVAIAAVKKAVR
ncbi:DUF1385 domain-containing protein [Candidatus Woesearchaeota archaeon]|nr:DUF1385 domain-containing protein [Candidatus Woesearchaeota archaeon]